MKTEPLLSSTSAPPAYAYRYKEALYLNITSRCPTACEFCIKFSWNHQYRGYNLLLRKEPTVGEILESVDDPHSYSEIVFCGYGESTYRLEEMGEIARRLKKRGARQIRLNTIGLGNLIQKRNIVPDLARFLDIVSISLNTADPKKWVQIHKPLPEFRDAGFASVCDFIRDCAQAIPGTYATTIETVEEDLKIFEDFVKNLGAHVRFRPYLDEYEEK